MCMNYERELVDTQSKVTELEKEVCVMDWLKEELKKESVFRKNMEEKWTESKELHKQEVWFPMKLADTSHVQMK